MDDLLQIGCARVRSTSLDRDSVIAARLRVGTALGSAELHPPGLPPSSILIVRALADRSDRGMLVEGRIPRPRAAWVRSTRDALDAMAREAARPRNGYLRSDATAVVFSDESEMLAALVADLAAGNVGSHWWWSTLLARRPEWRAGIHRVLVDRARLVPAVFYFLHVWGRIDAVARRLEPDQCADLVGRLANAYEFPAPPLAAAPIWRAAGKEAPVMYPDPPWSRSLTSLQGETTPICECMVGLALMLHLHPLRARTPDYTVRVNRWLEECVLQSAGRKRPRSKDEPAAERRNARAPVADGSKGLNGRADRLGPGVTGREDVMDAVDAGTESPSVEREPVLRTKPVDRSSQVGPNDTATPAERDSGARLPKQEAPSLRSRPEVQSVTTGLAGVFYLINLMTDLGLPETLEPDWRLASRLGPWGTLDLLARGLIEAAENRGSSEPEVGRLQETWIAPAGGPDGRPQYSLHPASHAPSHVPGLDPVWAVLAQLGGYEVTDGPRLEGPAESMPAGSSAATVSQTESLRAFILPWTRKRLTRRLGIGADQLRGVLFCRQGEIYLTAGHLDVRMSLAAISRPVRMSGLDRDPGWLPAWGRVIRFHFN